MQLRSTAVLFISLTAGLGFFWWLTEPVASVAGDSFSEYSEGNGIAGETVFWASGCASCHAAKGAEGSERLLLGGGHRLETPFGVFVTPNISPDRKSGIGKWNFWQFQTAMRFGVSPQGLHYYPAFPYTAYARMTDNDIKNLFAFMKTLPPVSRQNESHELALPFRWRRTLGIWKTIFASSQHRNKAIETDGQLERGRYLVEALGHCGECHTPRNIMGGLKSSQKLAGGPAPEGEGKIPNITPHANGIGAWSEDDIIYYLESGFTPDYDFVGGSMVSVQQNMTRLPKSDLEAIARYLKSVPPSP